LQKCHKAIGNDQTTSYQKKLKRLHLACGTHEMVLAKNVKIAGSHCPLCGINPKFGCKFCQVPLCSNKKTHAFKSCWEKWHSTGTVQGVQAQKRKKKAQEEM